MLDIHPPHHPTHTWADFFIHIATIVIGLLIAIGLEQTVEIIHHSHQRHQLESDLYGEGAKNRTVIARDLKIQNLAPWFDQIVTAIDSAAPSNDKIRVTVPLAPCIPGTIGTSGFHYFAPSQAVWTTARESSLVGLLPVEHARRYARLSHNYDLMAAARDDIYRGCSVIASMQRRLAKIAPGGSTAVWVLTPGQAERLAQTASETRVAIKALCFRLRWSDVYEQGILDGETQPDEHMMNINQERFEDPTP